MELCGPKRQDAHRPECAAVRAAPAFPVAPGPPSPLDPTLPPAPAASPKLGEGGAVRRASKLASLRSFLSSPRGRRRGPRPEAPFVCGLRRPFAQTLLKAPAGSPVPGPELSGSSPPAPGRPPQKRAEKHLRPTYLLVIRSVVKLEKQINNVTTVWSFVCTCGVCAQFQEWETWK